MGNNTQGRFHGHDEICELSARFFPRRHHVGVADRLFKILSQLVLFFPSLSAGSHSVLGNVWVTQRCIRLPVFQQPAFYEWVLKICESWLCSDVSILDAAWQLWSRVSRDEVEGGDERRGTHHLWKASLHTGAASAIKQTDQSQSAAVYTSYDNEELLYNVILW